MESNKELFIESRLNSFLRQLDEIASKKENYYRHINTKDKNMRREAAELIASGKYKIEFNTDLTDNEIAVFKANLIFWLLDMNEMADDMARVNLTMLMMRKNLAFHVRNTNKLVNDLNLKNIAKKPRNPHYAEAMRIAKATWEKYPGASKGQLCRSLNEYFNGKVSIDTLDSWIKKEKIQPPKPEKNTSFMLVI